MFLIIGSTVGAGVLALPAVTQPIGAAPSSAVLVAVWALLTLEALLLVDINLAVRHVPRLAALGARRRRRRRPPRLPATLAHGACIPWRRAARPARERGELVSMRAMAAATLGPAGASVVSVTYLALSYALLTAYSAKVADLTALTGGAVAPEAAQAALSAAFFGLIFCGGERAVESVNAALTKLLLLLFAGILAGTSARADWGTLAATADWDAAPRAISIAFLSLARARPRRLALGRARPRHAVGADVGARGA